MSDITLINDSEQSSLVTNGLAKNGELYLKKAGSTDAGSIVVYDSGSWRTFANEYSASFANTYSLDFDGTDSLVTIPQGTFDLGSDDWTLSMWVRPTNISATSETLMLIEGNSGTTERLGFFLRSNAWVVSDWYHKNITYSTTISNNTWYHLLVVKNGTGSTDIHLYFNGTKVSEGSHPASLNYGADSRAASIGHTNISGAAYPFQGQIDELGFWKSALTATQISEIYNSGVPISLDSYSPNGWWRMGDDDSGTGTTITDQGSGGNNGTLTNSPTFSTNVPS